MRNLAIVLVMCVAWSAGARAADFDFKGLTIGQPATPAEVKTKIGVDCDVGAPGLQVCNGNVTIAGQPASINLVIGTSGRIQRIALDFSDDAFDAVQSAMVQKFGAPAGVEESTLQNAMGAQYAQRVDVWGSAPAPTVRLSRYAGTIDKSSLTFRSEEDRKMLERLSQGNPSDI